MNKKKYETPTAKSLRIQSCHMICSSNTEYVRSVGGQTEDALFEYGGPGDDEDAR